MKSIFPIQVWHRTEPNFGHGHKGNFPENYELVALANVDLPLFVAALDEAFQMTNTIERWWGLNKGVHVAKNVKTGGIRSTSVGDVMVVSYQGPLDLLDRYGAPRVYTEVYFVAGEGFIPWHEVK